MLIQLFGYCLVYQYRRDTKSHTHVTKWRIMCVLDKTLCVSGWGVISLKGYAQNTTDQQAH